MEGLRIVVLQGVGDMSLCAPLSNVLELFGSARIAKNFIENEKDEERA